MRRSFLILATIALVASLAGPVSAEVQWAQSSWADILKTAKSQDKHVFIDFYATWCGPCKRLDKITYQDEKVMEFLATTIPVKYDAEKGVGEELAETYKVSAYPTMLVLDANGKEVDRHVGYLDPEPFVEKMGGYIKGIGTTRFYEQKLKNSPDDLETLFTLGMKHAESARPDEAKATLGRYLELDADNNRGQRADVLYALGDVHYSSEKYADSRKYFIKLTEEFQGTEWEENGLKRLAYVEHKLGNDETAVASYHKVVKAHEDDPGALNGFAWFCAQRGIGLDLALSAALKAADLSDRDAGILDTLAEVYFARGEFDDAIRIGKEALAKDKDDQYLKDQIKKFEKARDEAAAQASR